MKRISTSIWVSYVYEDSQDFVEQIRENIESMNCGIALNTFASKKDGGAEYVLGNGERIHSLTDTICNSNGVVFLFTEGFPESKYCCLELGWVIRRSMYSNYFLHVNGCDSPDYYELLAQSIQRFSEDDAFVPSFPENFGDLPAFEELQSSLKERTENTIRDGGAKAKVVAEAIAKYCAGFVRPSDENNIAAEFSGWLKNGSGEKYFKHLKSELKETDIEVSELVSSVFSEYSLQYVPNFERSLAGYRDSFAHGKNLNILKEIKIAAGYFALTLFEKGYIDSLRRFGGRHVVLQMDMPAVQSGSALSSIAIGIAANRVPQLDITDTKNARMTDARASDAIQISEIEVGSDDPEELERSYKTELIKQIWGVVVGTPFEVPEDASVLLSADQKEDIIAGIKHARAMGHSLNLHFTIDLKNYTAVPNWSQLVASTLDDLNSGLPKNSDDPAQSRELIPCIIVKHRTDSAVPWRADHLLRNKHLIEMLKLAQTK